MKLNDIVLFRSDLLFNGAVQIGWFEHDLHQAETAARHYIFHGPDYHGVSENDYDKSHRLLDTATFTRDILHRIYGESTGDPFELAIAGYGTGKSHLALTLACLCSQPNSSVSEEILNNLSNADTSIGNEVKSLFKDSKPLLIIALNGMQDFDLNSEIIRQVFRVLNAGGYDTSVLEDLRPRFRTAQVFTESFYETLKSDYEKHFGRENDFENIIESLKDQDEGTFRRVSLIYEQKMGSPIYAVGQESLHDFIRIVNETYCGPTKAFAGILIIFDEFGRYLEFSVQKPHVAGSGALQQLFECVQANEEGVFFLGFIQYELKAYISRIAPEKRDELNRYVTRYDSVNKVRLSTNLETLIANLLEKRNKTELQEHLIALQGIYRVQNKMQAWFPDLRNHSLWVEKDSFKKIVVEGCWPLHPISTWLLYKLSSAGKSLQQRSALSLLAEVHSNFSEDTFEPGNVLIPVDFCNESLISEFLAAERYGQQGATANSYETVVTKYEYHLSPDELNVLKAVLLSNKIGVKAETRNDYLDLLGEFCGLDIEPLTLAVESLEREYGVLEWNDQLRQYEIIGEAVPRRTFLDHLEGKAALIDSDQRADIFAQNYRKWSGLDLYNIDFGTKNNIATREWEYKIQFSNVALIKLHIDYAIKMWIEARGIDQPRGQLIYCYVGLESKIDNIKSIVNEFLKECLEENGVDWELGAPIAVVFLDDANGSLGQQIAEFWVLKEQMDEEEKTKFHNFIMDKNNSIKLDMENRFSELERERNVITAKSRPISPGRLSSMLDSLFNDIYFEKVAFPFDGFSTARGNAAKDCQLFTRQLYLGLLDRGWLMTQAAQQKNRGKKVLDNAWGIFNKDGSLRLKPREKTLSKIIELFDTLLLPGPDGCQPLNLGHAMRLLCSPPFGFNIASAGLVLAYFVGKRLEDINLLLDQKLVSVEAWLPQALQGYFLNLSVLDNTDVIVVSKETISEWERLLEDWETEETYSGKIILYGKALKMQNDIPVPQSLYYKYDSLANKTNAAQKKINEYNNTLDDAFNKIENGIEQNKLNILTWGASMLKDRLSTMEIESDKWTLEQTQTVREKLASARMKIMELFPDWYKRQTFRGGIENFGSFKHSMNLINRNLTSLGLVEEQKLFENHVKKVEENVRQIDKLRGTVGNINQMIMLNVVNDSTTMATLDSWLEQIKEYAKELEEASTRISVVENDVKDARKVLANFKRECLDQIESNNKRLGNIYNIEKIGSLEDISALKHEVTLLLSVFERDKDLEDIEMVKEQLDIFERHFVSLDDTNLNNQQFINLLEQSKLEIETMFEDAPPLDNDLIYTSIQCALQEKRSGQANDWMDKHLPSIMDIKNYDAVKALQTIASLQKRPKVLSDDQIQDVMKVAELCETRLDELEIDGLLVRFEKMSEQNKKAFIKKIESQVREYINVIA
jgi:hypothetical protein